MLGFFLGAMLGFLTASILAANNYDRGARDERNKRGQS
jgi:hypothetical protein